MINLDKILPIPLTCALIAFTLTNTPVNAQDVEEDVIKVKHKVIQLKKQGQLPTTIEIEENGDVKVIEMTSDELADKALLAEKLNVLDETTRETVLEIIANNERGSHKNIALFSNKEGDNISLNDIGTNFTGTHEVVLIKEGDDIEFKGKLKGHHSAIVKLIEKGDFNRKELDEIRAALDAKY
jgi:hypothetical protein